MFEKQLSQNIWSCWNFTCLGTICRAYCIRPHGGEDAHLTMVFCLPPSFHVRAHQGVCDTPLRFSRDVGTTVFLHLDLRNCFTINDEFANGEHSFTRCQWCFRDRKQWIESRAKSICHLRNEDCFMRKTAIVTAIMKLSLAQTLIATTITKLSLAQTSIATTIMKLSLAQTPIATAIMKLSLTQTPIATVIMKLSLRH